MNSGDKSNNTMGKRKRTPQEIETEVLTQSARRCCLCFGLQMDLAEKKGQIAHLDSNPANIDFENLAYLCIPHHDEYDSTTRQSKGLTLHEVKMYRTLLYEAVRQLRGDVRPVVHVDQSAAENEDEGSTSSEIHSLLAKVQARSVTLAQCLAEALAIAQKAGDVPFEKFCRNELSGYADPTSSPIPHRLLDVYVSGTSRINLQSIAWAGNASSVFEYMRREPEHFFQYKVLIAHSVSSIESNLQNSDLQKGIVTLSFTLGDINPDADNPNAELVAYAQPSDYQRILERIRRELTVYLLNLLPEHHP